MGENNLEETTSEKVLGIYIDNKLRLSDHVDAAVIKANRSSIRATLVTQASTFKYKIIGE